MCVLCVALGFLTCMYVRVFVFDMCVGVRLGFVCVCFVKLCVRIVYLWCMCVWFVCFCVKNCVFV